MGTIEDLVVNSILKKFEALPTKSKPRTLTNGGQEWVPLAGIAIVRDDNSIICVAIGTGMKCLPITKPDFVASGTVLHDWHAEILAIRAFNHYILQECHALASSIYYESPILRWRENAEMCGTSGQQPFILQDGSRIMIYCSEAPCGDASMELVMEAQEDATPWPVTVSSDDSPPGLLGRGSFSQLGFVRRKPSRADSPPTLSKSCSDKLALKQCTSLLSSFPSLLVSPDNAYIDTLILPQSQYRAVACERAFGPEGRMKPVATKTWDEGYAFRSFTVRTTGIEFQYSRRSAKHADERIGTNGSNISAVWTPRLQETLINGVLQGRKQIDPKGASALSRRRMMDLSNENTKLLKASLPSKLEKLELYAEMKVSIPLQERRRVKQESKRDALKGWNDQSDQGQL